MTQSTTTLDKCDEVLIRILNKFHHSLHFDAASHDEELQFFVNKYHERNTIQRKVQLDEQKLRSETQSVVVCKKCKLASVSFTNVQIRRADEGMSIMYVCRSCGFSWTDK